MMAKILYWTYEDSTDLGYSLLKNSGEIKTLAVPIMLLCLADQLITVDLDSDGTYSKLSERCSLEILKHIQVKIFVYKKKREYLKQMFLFEMIIFL